VYEHIPSREVSVSIFKLADTPDEDLPGSQRRRWSTPRVILSEIEDTEKLINIVEITLLPTGPS
jgi:hypothetical protein